MNKLTKKEETSCRASQLQRIKELPSGSPKTGNIHNGDSLGDKTQSHSTDSYSVNIPITAKKGGDNKLIFKTDEQWEPGTKRSQFSSKQVTHICDILQASVCVLLMERRSLQPHSYSLLV